MNVVSFDLPSGELLGLHGDLGGIWGNLLKGIDNKTVKGQLISKCLFGVIVWTKISTKKFDKFCPRI